MERMDKIRDFFSVCTFQVCYQTQKLTQVAHVNVCKDFLSRRTAVQIDFLSNLRSMQTKLVRAMIFHTKKSFLKGTFAITSCISVTTEQAISFVCKWETDQNHRATEARSWNGASYRRMLPVLTA
jgi:hypothetical protein